MKKWLFAILLGSALVLGACGSDDGANKDKDAEVTVGEEAYSKNNCAACHGNDLQGGAGPKLEAVGSEYSAEEIEDIIENGIGKMQPQKQVSDDDRAEIASWLAAKK